MYDVNFYMKVFDLMKRAEAGELHDRQAVAELLERFRNKNPIVYNIETTNACNMRCEMCPRTTMMTRSVETMKPELFRKLVDQLVPFPEELWAKWKEFVHEKYGVHEGDMSENHFFLLVIPKVIQLHGYGEPLIDKNMPEYVKLLSQRGFLSYFSCNPSNIEVDRTVQMFENGLSYIKYSIESVDDEIHRAIRGKASNFSESYKKICHLLEIKKARNHKTVIVITMLDLNRKNQAQEYQKLKDAFAGKDVYIYIKSEDQQWYRKDYHGTNSVHWSEFCKHPWMSMTIKSNGEVAMCMEDYNNEIILGNAKTDSLYDIWNDEKYRQFRHDHLICTPGTKCNERCDMKLIGDLVK